MDVEIAITQLNMLMSIIVVALFVSTLPRNLGEEILVYRLANPKKAFWQQEEKCKEGIKKRKTITQ